MTFCANKSAALVLSPLVIIPVRRGDASAVRLYQVAVFVKGDSSDRPSCAILDILTCEMWRLVGKVWLVLKFAQLKFCAKLKTVVTQFKKNFLGVL